MGGAGCNIVLDMSLTSNPNGLGYHGNQVYMVDSNFNQHVEHAHLLVYNLQERNWTELSQQVNELIPVCQYHNNKLNGYSYNNAVCRCLYVCDVIPSKFSIMTSKLRRHNGLFILAFHVHSCEIQCESLDNLHKFSQIKHGRKEDQLFYQSR